MDWLEIEHEESGGLMYHYGDWTVQPHSGVFGYETDNYLKWEILLQGKMYWDDKGHRNLTNKLVNAMTLIEELQRKWERDGFLWVSSTGAMEINRKVSRVPYTDPA